MILSFNGICGESFSLMRQEKGMKESSVVYGDKQYSKADLSI